MITIILFYHEVHQYTHNNYNSQLQQKKVNHNHVINKHFGDIILCAFCLQPYTTYWYHYSVLLTCYRSVDHNTVSLVTSVCMHDCAC